MESLPPILLFRKTIPPTPCFNVALNSGVRASTIWINIENGERGKSLVITPQWSNTFGPDCSISLFRDLRILNVYNMYNLELGVFMYKYSTDDLPTIFNGILVNDHKFTIEIQEI